MRIKAHATVALAASLALALSACGSDSDGDGGSDGAAEPLKVGALASLTGPASATFKAYPTAVNARIKQYEADKGKCASRGFEIIEADDASTADGALKASQKLIQSDNVDAVLNSSSFFYGASQFLTTQGKDVPIFSAGFDGAPEYADITNNIFSAFQPQGDYSDTFTEPGLYYDKKGVTKMSLISYDSPSATLGLGAARRSIEAAGIDIGYYSDKIQFGTTDVGPIVQGIIEAKSDGLYAAMNPETTFGIVGGLKQAGYMDKMKSIVLPTGYGADLLKSEPAVQAAQGVTFAASGTVPIEVGGAGVEKMSSALKTYAGNESGVPSFSESMGWLTADLMIAGLEAAGCDASPEEIRDATRKITKWDADGVSVSVRDFTTNDYDESCNYLLTLKDHAFVPDEDASPYCGTKIE